MLRVEVLLYGSLAKTGKGHGRDIAIQLGLCGDDPVSFDVNKINEKINEIKISKKLSLNNHQQIDFNPEECIDFLFSETLAYHPNAVTFLADYKNAYKIAETYYSVGGGRLCEEKKERKNRTNIQLPFLSIMQNGLLHWFMMDEHQRSGYGK